MTLPELCIKRPVFTTMLILLPIVLGIIGLMKMSVDSFPKVDIPIVVITTTRLGTSVEEMETTITKKIEEAVNTVPGIDELISNTNEGISQIRVTFLLEKDPAAAQQEVQSKINQVLGQLPTGTDAPIIDKVDLQAIPITTIAVSGKRSLREITDIADRQVKDAITSINGVGSVTMLGGNRRAIQVRLDTDRLQGYNLSVEQVKQALANQNMEIPGGRVDQGVREVTLRTMGRVKDPRDFNEIIIANVNGQPLRIKDVGRADDDVEEIRTAAYLNGNPTVNLTVLKQSGENTVDVINRVKARLKEIKAGLDAQGKNDVELAVIRDQSRFIVESIHEIEKTLLLGGILVSLTILLFLRDWRTMVIASISIPISIVSTFAAMHAAGFTFDTITMLALVMAVGIVIDDAVVVHENIFRWMEEKGYSAWDAAREATKEIALAVLATTLSLVVIFLPIAFMSGMVGRFFKSFGLTMAFAIMISMLVSFTLTPMLCARFLKLSRKAKAAIARGDHTHHSGGVYGWLAEKPYLFVLRWSLRHRWAVVLAAVVTFVSLLPIPFGNMAAGRLPANATAEQKAAVERRRSELAYLNWPGLVGLVGKDFLPADDQSEFDIDFTMPPGSTLAKTTELLKNIEASLRTMPPYKIDTVLSSIGDTTGRQTRGTGDVTKASMFVRIPDLKDRPYTQFEVMEAARKVLAKYPDVRSSVSSGNIGTGQVQYDLEMILTGPNNDLLNEYSDMLLAEMRKIEGLVDVDTTLPHRKPELRLTIDRAKASELGVNIREIASTLQTVVGGQIVSDFKDEDTGEQYDVWLRAQAPFRDTKEAVENLMVWSQKAGMVKIASLATLSETRGPGQIDRFNLQRKMTLVANTARYEKDNQFLFFKWRNKGQLPVSVAQDQIDDIYHRLQTEGKIIPGYTLDYTGRAKRLAESNSAFGVALVLSLVFMYMILAAQFESFIHPVTILLAVPLTIPFAILSMILLDQSLNLYAILGVFLLFGIVKKNGILQVDYANQMRAKGLPIRDAVLEANKTRLRPILMTTVMLVAGMVPLALAKGPGAGTRSSMANVIIGGQTMSLLLTLLVTPVAYTIFDDISRLFRRKKKPQADKPHRIDVALDDTREPQAV
jgi:HAE1 family hydrophobic/amphiphilic exporter-1